jgi:hypothetical protein
MVHLVGYFHNCITMHGFMNAMVYITSSVNIFFYPQNYAIVCDEVWYGRFSVLCISLFLTCTGTCLRRRLFRVTFEISRTVINLAYRDIVMSQRGHWPLLIRTRYVCTCLRAGSEMGGGIRKIKAIRWGAYYYSLVLNLTCDMYKSSLRHIHNPVLSSLKMKGIRLLFFNFKYALRYFPPLVCCSCRQPGECSTLLRQRSDSNNNCQIK